MSQLYELSSITPEMHEIIADDNSEFNTAIDTMLYSVFVSEYGRDYIDTLSAVEVDDLYDVWLLDDEY